MCLSVPSKLVSVLGEDPLGRTGKVSIGGVVKEISLAYVPEARLGDYLLVHVGFAISVISEQDARFVFEYLEQTGQPTGADS